MHTIHVDINAACNFNCFLMVSQLATVLASYHKLLQSSTSSSHVIVHVSCPEVNCYRKMSAEIPTDDPQAKDSAQEDSAQRDSAKNFPQNAPSPYMDEDLDEGPALDADTYPLISPIAASPQSQPDQYYPAMPNRKLIPSMQHTHKIYSIPIVTCCMHAWGWLY